MTLKSRIATEPREGGKTDIVVQDPHTGKVVSRHSVPAKAADQEVRKVKEILDRKGHQTEVTGR